MEQLVDTFFEIDKEFKGSIEVKDLEHFVEEKNLEDSMIQTWLKLFDPEKTGSISLRQFCNRLGLVADAVEAQRLQHRYSKLIGPSDKLGPDIDVKFVHMREELQLDLVAKVRKLLESGADPVQLITQLKTYLDCKYGYIWHTIVISGPYTMSHAHMPEYSFHFQIGEYNVIAWRTPVGFTKSQ